MNQAQDWTVVIQPVPKSEPAIFRVNAYGTARQQHPVTQLRSITDAVHVRAFLDGSRSSIAVNGLVIEHDIDLPITAMQRLASGESVRVYLNGTEEEVQGRLDPLDLKARPNQG